MCCCQLGESEPSGKAYGLDMTDEMLALARENQREVGTAECRVSERRD